jgi:glycosyltransferase involved in cell wall biosynthesis
MRGLNIVFVNAEDPALARTGYLLLTQQLISMLGRKHRLSIIVLNGAELGTLGTDTHVLNRRPKDAGKRLGQILSVFSRESMVIHQTRFAGCHDALVNCLNNLQPDLVIFNHIRSAWLAPEIKQSGFKSIYIAHNAEGATAQSVANMQRFGLTRVLLRQEAQKVEELESRIMRAVDHAVALTPEDAERLKILAPRTPVSVIPPFVDVQECAAANTLDLEIQQQEVLLLGSFRWLPKRLNAMWLAEKVMPRVRERRPDVVLRIVGTEADGLALPLRHCPGVSIHSNVPSVQNFYARAAVFAVPERQAGGIKLKTLEAASFGKAIVTTAAGCEGTGLRDEVNCLIADSADEFADCIVDYLDNSYLRQSCGAAARSHVMTRFNAASIASSYEALLQACTSARNDAYPVPKTLQQPVLNGE